LRDFPACVVDDFAPSSDAHRQRPTSREDHIRDRSVTDQRTGVGLVDDHPAVLASLGAAVAGTDDLVLIGTAATVADAMALASTVDVLVCDVQLDGHAEGLRILELVHRPEAIVVAPAPAVILLSGFDQPSLVRAAIERGAAGFLGKTVELRAIIDAIRTVAAGGTVFTATALQSSRTADRRPSDREIQVIGLVRDGATNAEVAAALGRSEKTVESHLRRLFDRYGLMSRTELVVRAIDDGWIGVHRDPR
jgi:DNA-binding NarL/FixJ family response regulator